MRVSRTLPFSIWPLSIWLVSAALCAPDVLAQTQEPRPQAAPPPTSTATPSTATTSTGPTSDQNNPDNWSMDRRLAMLDRVIANQKKNDEGDSIYEHIEKKEIRKGPAATTTPEIRVT
jgi:hypothetical protein